MFNLLKYYVNKFVQFVRVYFYDILDVIAFFLTIHAFVFSLWDIPRLISAMLHADNPFFFLMDFLLFKALPTLLINIFNLTYLLFTACYYIISDITTLITNLPKWTFLMIEYVTLHIYFAWAWLLNILISGVNLILASKLAQEFIKMFCWLLICYGIIVFILLLVEFNYSSFWIMSVTLAIFWSILSFFMFFDILIYDLHLWKNTNVDTNKFYFGVDAPYFDTNSNTIDFNLDTKVVQPSINFIRTWFIEHNITLNLKDHSVYYIFVISIISVFANLHTLIYMAKDQKKERFIMLLNAFSFSMLFLTLSTNWVFFLLCWEFLGITSFFLITHNETQTESLRAATKALVFNLISDAMLLFLLVINLYVTNSILMEASALVNTPSIDYVKVDLLGNSYLLEKSISMYALLIFLFFSAVIKSVQMFSFMWLPESMKAPVPASALIHSATLVAAGFFVLLEMRDVYIHFFTLNVFICIGFGTAFCGALSAAYQEDLKKILAFSTIANCGFMLVLLFAFDVHVFLIYFTVHGIFKSICFMFSGEIINNQSHSQDFRTYDTLSKSLLVNIVCAVLTLFLLAGFPFTLVYIIKHYFMYTANSALSFGIFDALSWCYTLLSLCYAMVFSIRIFVFPSKKKTDSNCKDIKETDLYRTSNNIIYAMVCLTVTMFLEGSFSYYNSVIGKNIFITDLYCVYVSTYFIGMLMAFFFVYQSNAFDVKSTVAVHVATITYLVWLCSIINHIFVYGIGVLTLFLVIIFGTVIAMLIKYIWNNLNLYCEIL